MAERDDWLMGALAAGDAYRGGDPPWPPAPPTYPGMSAWGNIDLDKRPVVRNADGSISTVRSMGVNFGDGETLIPTVSQDGRVMGDDEAVDYYRKTGQHLGKFDTPENASAYAQRLHEQQAEQYLPQTAAPPDSPWARGVAAASDYAGRETPAVKVPPGMGSVLGMGRAGEIAQAVGDKYGKALDYYAGMARRQQQGVTPEVPGQWSENDEARQQQLLAERYNWGPQTAFGMVFDPFGVKRSVGAGGVTLGSGAGGGSRIIQRQVGGPGIGVRDPFPGSTGLERPQGNWMVRHNTGTPELVISGEGGHGFSSSKTGVPVEEARFDIRNPVSPENPKVFDIEELQRRKAAFILAGHDRLMGGGELVGAGGRTFKKPVPLEAGSNYPMVHEGKVLLPDDPEAAVLFANAQGPATKFNRVAEEARQQGYDPYLAGVLMNKTSGDSAKQMGRTVHEALRVAPVGKDLAGKIDASIEGALGTVKGKLELPFPGIKNRGFGQWLDGIGGAHRAAAIKAIDQKRFVKEGAPDVGELRIANTNPLLLNTPVGSIGRLIGAMRPEAGTLNAGLHSTYGTTFFGNRGEIGGLPGSAPFHLMAPDVHRGLLAAGPAKQFANVPAYYATLEMPKSVSRIQPVTQEVVDNYLGFIRKHPGGWATAGVVPFAGEAYRRMGGLADQSEYQQ